MQEIGSRREEHRSSEKSIPLKSDRMRRNPLCFPW